jgi:predicted nucleic acid-binding protein
LLYIQNKTIILDTSVIIAFYSEINEPLLLEQLIEQGYQIAIPIAVYNEIKNPTFSTLKRGVDTGNLVLLDPISSTELKQLKDRYPSLKNGELEVISWGSRFQSKGNQYTCVIDERIAREIAKSKGLNLTGTKGLLSLLVSCSIIDENMRIILIERLTQNNPRM